MKITASFISILSVLIISCTKSSTTTTTGSVPQIATASSSDITSITQSSASFSATITSDGGSAITAKGICWSTSHNPTIADSKTTNRHGSGTSGNTSVVKTVSNTSFVASLTGLNANTTYYARVYATNSSGTAYSNEVNFVTAAASCGTTATDIDGNVYNVVTIGTQCWMKENLRVTRFKNGDSIPKVQDAAQWAALPDTSKAYSVYQNNLALVPIIGRHYTWPVAGDSRGACPTGWHVPTNADFETLINYIGGIDGSAKKLKSSNTSYWMTNAQGTDDFGFNAVGSGYRDAMGAATFTYLQWECFLWSSTYGAGGAGAFDIAWDDDAVPPDQIMSRKMGFSIRCVKD